MNNWKHTFKIILGGQVFSLVGSAAAQFALVWYLTVRTGSAAVLAGAGICAFLPQAVLGPFAGTWIDRTSRRKVMIAADSFIAAVSLVLMLAALHGEPPVWMVFLALFLRAAGGVFHAPALQASIPMIVPEQYIERASGINQFVFSGSNMLGPVLGALLYSMYSVSGAMLLDVVGAAFAVATLLAVRIPDPPPEPRKHIWAEMKAGIAAIRHNRILSRMTWPLIIAMLFYFPVSSLYPLMVSGYFGKTAWHSSMVEAVFASGMLGASLIIGIWGGMKNKFMQMSLAIFALGMFLLFSGLLPPGGFYWFVVFSAILGLMGSFFWLAYIVHVQTTVSPGIMGRVLSLMASLMSLTIPFGLFLAAPFAETLGIAVWFVISGAAIMAAGLLGMALAKATPSRLGGTEE